MNDGTLYRLAAFAEQAGGGNPAGVWIGSELPTSEDMQRIATEVGFSETAFVAPTTGSSRTIRYFSPEAEVSFCGHAPIAAGVMLGRTTGEGRYQLSTQVGEVSVSTRQREAGYQATLVSVDPEHQTISDTELTTVLDLLGWRADALDPAIKPVKAFAGAWHLVIAVSRRDQLRVLDYDFKKTKAFMLEKGLTTLLLTWREQENRFHARNPFPVGGVYEDPATGAAAAALGGYLRDAGLITAPMRFEIHQGADMGRPSMLRVEVPESGGISVSGFAVDL